METMTLNKIDLSALKIASLGYGNMQKGIMEKLFADGIISKENYTAIVGRPESREILIESGISSSLNHQEIENADIVFLSYKQKNFWEEEVHQNMEGKIIISIIAGIHAEDIQKKFPGAKVVRAMPNRGSVVGEGCSFLKFSRDFNELEKTAIREIFQESGDVYEVENLDEINKATILGASMIGVIAFFKNKVNDVLHLAEDDPKSREFFENLKNVVENLAKKYDFFPEVANEIVEKTFRGLEKLHHRGEDKSKNKYSYIQASVTSPNGTTHAMIEYLKSVDIDYFLENIFQAEHLFEKEKREKFAGFLEKSYLSGMKRADELSKN